MHLLLKDSHPGRPPLSPTSFTMTSASQVLTELTMAWGKRLRSCQIPQTGLAIWEQRPQDNLSFPVPVSLHHTVSSYLLLLLPLIPTPLILHGPPLTLPLICLFSSFTRLPAPFYLPHPLILPLPPSPPISASSALQPPYQMSLLHHCPLSAHLPCPHALLFSDFLIEAQSKQQELREMSIPGSD